MDDLEVRVGLIGYGFAGKTFHAPLVSADPSLKLTAVASSDPAKVQADLPGMRVFADPLELMRQADIDLVVIASPNRTHAPLAAAALLAGKHVVVDKPFTLDLAEARRLSALANEEGRLLSVFHNRRWDSDFLTVRRAIDEGLVGTVAHYESHFDRFRPDVRARWREDGGPGSGVWFDLGPHLVDQALQLFGPPLWVQGSLARQREGALTDDWAHVVLDYGRCQAVLHAGMLAAVPGPRFVVHGSRSTLVKQLPDRQEAQLREGMQPGAPTWGEDPDDLAVVDGQGASHRRPATPGDQRRYYRAVAEALTAGAPNPVTPAQATTVMAVVEAAASSAVQRRAVELDLTVEERAAWGSAPL